MNNKGTINGKIYDIIDLPEYNPELYDPKTTAVQKGDYLYPIKTSESDEGVGVYMTPGNPVSVFREPVSDYEREIYMAGDNVIDFKNIKNMSECIDAQAAFLNMERTILTTPDNIFVPVVGENDEPAMRALKEAVVKKGIDLDKYAPRFGANYCNDKRLFKGSSITMAKLTTMANNLDMKCTLIVEDANPDVPNPIGDRIVVNLCSEPKEED